MSPHAPDDPNRETADPACGKVDEGSPSSNATVSPLHEAVLDSLPVVSFTCAAEPSCPTIEVSPNVDKLTGFAREKFLADPGLWLSRVHPDDRGRVRGKFNLPEGRERMQCEYRWQRADGEWLWLWELMHADASGRCWQGLAVDVTLRKRTERTLESYRRHLKREVAETGARLAESEARYRSIFEDSEAVMFLVNPDTGRIKAANPSACDFYGYLREELEAMTVFDLNTLSEEEVRRQLQLARDGHDNHFEFAHRLADGRKRTVEVFSSPITERGKTLLHSIVHDVTDRKMAETALIDSERNMRTLLNAPRLCAYLVDENGRVMAANEVGSDRFDLDPDEMVGRLFGEFGDPETADRRMARTREAATSLSMVSFREIDAERTFHTTCYPLFDSFSDKVRVGVFSDDITRQIEIEKQLRRSQKMEAVGTLASGVAHEFNNLLAVIGGFSEMAMESETEDPFLTRCLREIHNATKRAKDIVGQLLTFSRGDERTRRPLDPLPLVKEGLQFLRATLPRSVAIEARLPEKAPRIVANPTHMQQILFNLVKNAADAIEDQVGTVRVTLQVEETRGEARLELAVSDDGQGIPEEIRESVFEPFFTTKPPGRGTGLGLCVVHGIVTSLGGSIDLFSEPGRGTTVRVALPGLGDHDATEDEVRREVAGGTESVLFVDDEPAICLVAEKMLAGMGYSVTAMTSPVEALEVIKRDPERFDVLVTDQAMPEMTGLTLTRLATAARPDLPVVVCTGYAESMLPSELERLPVHKVLTKPFLRDELAAAVRSALAG